MPDEDCIDSSLSGRVIASSSDRTDDSFPSLGSSNPSSGLGGALRAARPFRPGASLEGQLLANGRISVGRRIGGGAMGIVYEAVCDGREMAIKVLNQPLTTQIYRLKTEFRRLSQLNHPNVVCAYELFNEDQEWFFSMERVQGLPLHRYLEARYFAGQEWTYESELRSLLQQLVAGMAAIHGAGLVHRDIKPTNVLVTSEGRLVIVDFGLVSEQAAGGVGQTIDNRISGTVGYIAPEVLRGEPATQASDSYALGATLHQLLTGKLPRLPAEADEAPATPLSEPLAAAGLPHDLAALCARLLAVDPQKRPSTPELVTLCEQWSTQSPAQGGAAGAAVELFVGREKELEFLRGACERTHGGTASIVVLFGGTGVGKSALQNQLVSEIRAKGGVVLEGRCSEWESVPYKGLDEVIDSLSRLMLKVSREQAAYLVPRHVAAVVRVFPTLLRVETFAEAAEANPSETEEPWLMRSRAVAGLKDTFYRLAERHRVVLAIHDLQWIDADTIQLLADLLSPPAPPNLLLLASITDDASARELVGELARAAEVVSLTLEPLDAHDSRELARAVLPASLAEADPGLLERMVREARGIPLYITEFAREIADSPEGGPPLLFSQVLLSRVERLQGPARQLLELVVIAVRPLTMRVADLCMGDHVRSLLRQLMAQHLVSSQALAGGDLGFKPFTELVRQVVLHAMPDERAVRSHALLVHALESLPNAEPEWLLAHYRGAGRYEAARHYCIIVAERALAVLAFDQAASMYMAALELTSEHSSDWIELNRRCADALSKADRGAEAAQAYVRAARSAGEETRALLLNLAVTHWIRSGHIVEGVRLLRTSLEAAGIAWPETAGQAVFKLFSQRAAIRLRGLACTPRPEAEVPTDLLRKLDALNPAQTALGTFDYLRGATFAAIALPLALKAREPKRLVVALTSEAIYSAMLDGLSGERRALRVQHQIDEVRQHGTGPYEHAASRIARAMCSYWTGRWKDVPPPARQAESILRKHLPGALWELSLLRSIRHTVLLHAGQFNELVQELPEGLSYASVRDDRYAYLDLLRRSVIVHLVRGNASDAQNALERLHEQRLLYPFIAFDHLIMSAVVATHLYTGDAPKAQRELAQRWAQCRRAGLDRLPLVRLTVIGMEADCVVANEETPPLERARLLERLGRAAGKEKIAWAGALRCACLGMAADLEGKPAEAAFQHRCAIDGFSAAGLTVAAAVAEWRLGNSLEAEPSDEDAANADGQEQGSPARSIMWLREAGIAEPARWFGIVHSLY